jgi:uncharacterized protein (TIGR00661 family)
VAPLDWGLGHATRCIPVIKALLQAGCTVLLAGEGKTATLLQAEFPQLNLLPLPGYAVQYSKGSNLAGKLFLQIPKIRAAISREHLWLQNAAAEYGIDGVIADNRYGLYHPGIPCIFITHQLLIKTGFGALSDRLLQRLAYRYINRFSECWVPDAADGFTLAGQLAHPKALPKTPVRYIQFLSRFEYSTEEPLTHHLLVLLSGPEPQRSILERLLLQQVKELKEPVFFVRGLPGSVALPAVPYQVTIVNHLPTGALQKAVEGATYIISRCGYSSVMDVVTLRKKAIMIPTPGQTEQEYLATHLTKNNIALCIPQSKFKLKNALDLAAAFPYAMEKRNKSEALQNAVLSLTERL